MTIPDKPPFHDEYPTLDEVHQALGMVGIEPANFANIVTNPMDQASGPLDTELTRCKSARLSQGWPKMFTAAVHQLLKQ